MVSAEQTTGHEPVALLVWGWIVSTPGRLKVTGVGQFEVFGVVESMVGVLRWFDRPPP